MSRKKTTEEFVQQIKDLYGDVYDYSKVKYNGNKVPVCIICHKKDKNGMEHGEFWPTPNNFLRGTKCPKCYGNIKKTNQQFIEQAKSIHGNKYIYDKVNYINNKTPVIITCPIHGDFSQCPQSHLEGRGCYKCAVENSKYTKEEWIDRVSQYHNYKYDYSQVNYIDWETKVKIICPIHGEFFQSPHNHTRYGCPKCNSSSGENTIIKYLNDNQIQFVYQYQIPIDKTINSSGKAYIDFYIPKYQLFIEYNGMQHYCPNSYFGGITGYIKQRNRDLYIKNYADSNNIKFLEIPYTIIDDLIDYLNFIFKHMENIKIIKQTLYTQWINTDTGELFEDSREFTDDSIVTPKKKSTTKKKKNEWDDDPRPLVIREDNKLILNEAAVAAMGVTEGDRINIKMQVINRRRYPVIGTEDTFGDKGGNLLTKSHTIRYGGKNNDELAKFGYIFVMEPQGKVDGLFILKNENATEEDTKQEEVAISIQEELDDLNANLTDDEAEMVDELNFNLDDIA